MAMKKILFISPEYPPETGAGGIGTYVYAMAKALKSLDREVSVSVLSVSFEKNKRNIENGVEVIRLKINRKNPLSIHWAFSIWILRNYTKYDIIEDETFGGYCFLAKLLLGKKYRYVARLHGTSYEVYTLEQKKGLKAFIFRSVLDFFESFIAKRAEVILADSALMATYAFFLWNIDFSRMNIVSLPIAIESVGKEYGNLPETLQGKDYFLFYGSVQKKKGSEVLKKIIPRVLELYPNMQFVVLGNDREKLADFFQKESRVIFFSYIGEKEKLVPIIKNAKVAVLPSHFESFLYTAVEAICYGVPTIMTKNCGVTEHLMTFSDYDNIVTEQNNTSEFLDKISDIMGSYEKAKLRTDAQGENFQKRFDPKTVAERYLNLLEEKYNAR